MPSPSTTRRFADRARALHAAGRTQEAIGLLRDGLGRGETDPLLLSFLGALEFFAGQTETGLEHGRQAAALAPDNAVILGNYGAQLVASGLADAAVAVLRKALDLDPASSEARLDLARALLVGERYADAAETARSYVAARPDDPRGYGILFETHLRENRFAAAGDVCARLLARDPDSAEALGGLVDLSIASGDLAAACRRVEALVRDRPSLVNGSILARRIDLAALVEGPDGAAALCADILRGNRGATGIAKIRRSMLLMGGRFEEGWRAFGEEGDRLTKIASLPHRAWRGESNEDRTLLIRGAEGVGEQLLYSQLFSRTRKRVRRLIVECDGRLLPVFTRTYADIEFVGWTTPPQKSLFGADIDMQCLPRDLGGLFIRAMDDIEGPPRNLAGNPEGAAVARALRTRYPGKRLVGISWRSSSHAGGRKSVPLTQWSEILSDPRAAFVNLQYGSTDSEIGLVRDRLGVNVVAPESVDMTDDIDRAMGLISGLDLVITVSNVTAHYAGNAGVPCWVLVGKSPLWHWFTGRSDSPWYPSVRLYRQLPTEPWAPVLQRVAADLRAFAG